MAHPEGNPSTEKRPPIIGIDGGTWANRRGYGRFLREILPPLAEARRNWRFVVFLDRAASDAPPLDNVRWVDAGTRESVTEAASADGARTPADLLRMSRAVNHEKLDLLFFPTIYSYFPVLRRIPIVVGIHDTMADRHPEWAFAGKKQELLWRAKVRMALAQATRIVTVSHHSRRNIVEQFGLAESAIAVVSEAAAPIFRPMDIEREEFLLAVGGISPNKNLSVLIEAMPALRAEFNHLRLVLVGDYSGDSFRGCYEQLHALRGKLGLESSVEFAGFIPDEDLAVLYSRARLFVMPSLEEGFGLPLAEAMACGCPSVVASGHSLEEIGGDAVDLAPPTDPAAWARSIAALLRDAPARTRLSENAIQRSNEFTWHRGAESLAAVFEELLTR